MTKARKRSVPVEADLLILSFLAHFAWELLQAPLFSSLNETEHFTGIVICLRATLGDVGIALAAFWCAAIFGGGRNWVARPGRRALSLFFGVGLIATVGLEFVNIELLNRWSYAPNMPRLPVFGTGVAPLMQWLVVPALIFWYLSRLARQSWPTDTR